MITNLCDNMKRTKKIADVVNGMSGERLLLTSRRSHGEDLHSLIPNSRLCMGGSKDIGIDKGGVLISTYNFASEGLDLPCLSSVILATPISSPSLLEQCIGRILRSVGDKKKTIVDFVDRRFANMFRKRKVFYKENYNVK